MPDKPDKSKPNYSSWPIMGGLYMNDRSLRIFHEVAKSLNMTVVAQKMFISQSAVSQTIHDMESELGIKLFSRIGKKLYLTGEGEIWLNYVRRMLNVYNEGLMAIDGMKKLQSGRLKIGASTTIGIYVMPQIFGKFMKLFTGIDFSTTIENTKIIIENIINNKIDFGFVEGPVSLDEIVIEDFCEDELVLIVAPAHAWARLGNIDSQEIFNEKFIMREMGSGTREVFENILNANQIQFKIAFELGNTEAIKKAVEAGLGVSCISRRCIYNEVESGKLCIVNIRGVVFRRKFNLVFHKDKYLTYLHKKFIDFASNEVITKKV